jgi:chromosome segregation ATPase
LDSLVTLIGGIVVVASALGTAVAVARASFAKTQIEALRGDRDDLRTRVDILESEKTRLEASLKTESDKVRVLEKVVTGKEQLDHLQSTIDNNHAASVSWQEGQEKRTLDILKLLRGKREGETGPVTTV